MNKKNRFKPYLVSSNGKTAVFRTGYNRHEKRDVATGKLIQTIFKYTPNDTTPKVKLSREESAKRRMDRIGMYKFEDRVEQRIAAKNDTIGTEFMSDEMAENLKTTLHNKTQSEIEKDIRSKARKHTVINALPEGKSKKITIYSSAFMQLFADTLHAIKDDVMPMNVIEEC